MRGKKTNGEKHKEIYTIFSARYIQAAFHVRCQCFGSELAHGIQILLLHRMLRVACYFYSLWKRRKVTWMQMLQMLHGCSSLLLLRYSHEMPIARSEWTSEQSHLALFSTYVKHCTWIRSFSSAIFIVFLNRVLKYDSHTLIAVNYT